MAYLFQNTREQIGRWILKKRIKNKYRNSQFLNYSNANNIGIIFNATHQNTYEVARKYIRALNEMNISVKALGFVDSKEVLEFYQKSIYFEFFSRKNLNWYHKPNNPNTKAFIETKFDILIDLSIVEDFPIQYIVALSEARFKVGSVKGTENYYDFMIRLDEKQDLEYFVEQIDHYLKMIKN